MSDAPLRWFSHERFSRQAPEVALLIMLSREEPNQAFWEAIDFPNFAFSPSRLADLASIHKVGPLVLSGLSATHRLRGRIRQEDLVMIRRQAVNPWLLRRTRLLRLRADIELALQERNCPFIFIRGLNLAERYYADPVNRPSVDLDVLVPESKLALALDGLDSVNLAYVESLPRRAARSSYMGQIEFRSKLNGIGVDLNYQLTGNAGIGNVCQNMDRVWERAVPIKGHEYALSAEDEILELVRHLAHGHGFMDGFLRTCSDIRQLVRSKHGILDWAYIANAARNVECYRAFQVFAEMYDKYYCVEPVERLDSCPAFFGTDSDSICTGRFWRTIALPSLSYDAMPSSALLAMRREVLSVAARCWSVDSWSRRLFFLRVFILPMRSEQILLGDPDDAGSRAWGFIKHFIIVLPLGMAGLILGSIGRVFDRAGRSQCIRRR